MRIVGDGGRHLAPPRLRAEAAWRACKDETPVGVRPRLVERPRHDRQKQSALHDESKGPINVGTGVQDVVGDYGGQLRYVFSTTGPSCR